MATTITNFIQRLRQLAEISPDKTVIVEGSRVTSRKKLVEMAYKVSSLVKSRVSQPSAFIPIVLPNGADYIAAELGIWMSGNASVENSISYTTVAHLLSLTPK